MKNERNDDDIKMMQWLMTGGNHGTIDISIYVEENLNMNCDEIYHELPQINHSGSKRECIRSSRLINQHPAKLLK